MESEPSTMINWKDRRILVVEDEQVNQVVLKALLRNTGVDLLNVTNGYDAITIVEKEPVDVVLLDIRLPGINGYETARRIRQFNKHIPIIGQSAFATAFEREQMLESGIDDFVLKPFRKRRLIQVLGKYFSEECID